MVVPQNQTSMQALVPRTVPEAVQLAETFAKASLVPEHLRGKPGDCLLVVMQAQRWGMDALSVAQCTSVVRGKLCYEGKLVAAVLYSMGAIDGRLRYEFDGEGQRRRITVTGRPRGMDVDQVVSGTVADWMTENGNWKKSPDDMLVYRGTRQWARRYAPEALLGVYTPDELDDEPVRAQVVGQSTIRVEQAKPAESTERTKLIADLYAKADEGADALERAWIGLTKADRKSVGVDEWERIKARAKPAIADAEVVE